MGNTDTAEDFARTVSGALAWWQSAGVDYDFVDAPQPWLTPGNGEAEPGGAHGAGRDSVAGSVADRPTQSPAAPPPATAKPAPAPQLGGAREGWPTTLPGFQAWWLTEPSLDEAPPGGRVPPRGPGNPELMILVPEPEEGDGEHLLSGPRGRLLSAMLPLLGFAEAEVYIASALPRHTPLVDWSALAAQGMGAVLAHHVSLVAPRRVVAFGGNVLSLLGHNPTQNTAIFHAVNHEGSLVPLLPSRELGMLLERPAAKAGFWQHWLAFSSGSTDTSGVNLR